MVHHHSHHSTTQELTETLIRHRQQAQHQLSKQWTCGTAAQPKNSVTKRNRWLPFTANLVVVHVVSSVVVIAQDDVDIKVHLLNNGRSSEEEGQTDKIVLSGSGRGVLGAAAEYPSKGPTHALRALLVPAR